MGQTGRATRLTIALVLALSVSVALASLAGGATITKRDYVKRADAVCKRLDPFDIKPFLKGVKALDAGKLDQAADFFTKSQRAELNEVRVLDRIQKPSGAEQRLNRWLDLQAEGAKARLKFADKLREGKISNKLDDRASNLSRRAAEISTSYGISCFGTQPSPS